MLYHVSVGGRTFQVELDEEGIRVDGRIVEADLAAVEGTDVRSLLLDGASYRLVVRPEGAGRWNLLVRGRRYRTEVVDERTRAIREMTGAGADPVGPRPIRAPMPGLVVKVEVTEGDRLEEGQGVVIVEAMKMENELRASSAGVVTRVHVAEGEAVEKDQILVELADPEGDGAA